jgi:hypothetical protein
MEDILINNVLAETNIKNHVNEVINLPPHSNGRCYAVEKFEKHIYLETTKIVKENTFKNYTNIYLNFSLDKISKAKLIYLEILDYSTLIKYLTFQINLFEKNIHIMTITFENNSCKSLEIN